MSTQSGNWGGGEDSQFPSYLKTTATVTCLLYRGLARTSYVYRGNKKQQQGTSVNQVGISMCRHTRRL